MNSPWHEGLKSRYTIEGKIVMETAFHLGSGHGNTLLTDNPILKDAYGQPLIPGSSIKGAFRSAVERIAPSLGAIRTCGLVEGYDDCLTTCEKTRDEMEKRRENLERQGKPESFIEKSMFDFIMERLCQTCLLFGSPFTASKVLFSDSKLLSWAEITEIRDGVAIDRDSERAVDQHKFDFEVVPSQAVFKFEMQMENLCPEELGLIAVGLREFEQKKIFLGGMRSRGLGRCKLEKIKIHSLDLTNPTEIAHYLLNKQMTEQDTEPFIQGRIEELLRTCSLPEGKQAGGNLSC